MKVLFTVWFHKSFKLNFLKQPSLPNTMYAEHWRKLAWTTFLENFLMPFIQQFCEAIMSICLLEYATVFPIKNKFSYLTSFFDFLF